MKTSSSEQKGNVMTQKYSLLRQMNMYYCKEILRKTMLFKKSQTRKKNYQSASVVEMTKS